MSHHFNAAAFEIIDNLGSALLAAHEAMPQSLIECGHALHRAVDDFAEACYFHKQGGIDLARDDYRRCKRSLKTALELLTAASITD